MVKILGLTVIAIRLPGVILGLGAIVAGFFLIKRTLSFKCALTFMAIMIACPWHVMQSRFGLDCNLLSSMMIISIALLAVSKKWWQYLIAGISFGLTLYTYALSYIIVPIFLAFTMGYLRFIKKITIKNVMIFGIPIAILATPLILMLLVNMGYLEQINFGITIPKLFSFRAGELGVSHILENLQNLILLLTSDGLMYNSIPEFGTIYYFAIPLAGIGFVISGRQAWQSLRKEQIHVSSYMMFLFIANLCLICLTPTNVNKANSIYIALLYFIMIAIWKIYQKCKPVAFVIAAVYGITAIAFFHYYFYEYSVQYANIGLVDKELVATIQQMEQTSTEEKIYIGTQIHQPSAYAAYALQISPYELNQTKRGEIGANWKDVMPFGRYYFK